MNSGQPYTRYGMRGSQFTRQWKILVLLRQRAHTLSMLAKLLDCSPRTVRRDIYTLQAVPLPIYTVGGFLVGDSTYYKVGPMEGWQKQDATPTKELRAAVEQTR